MRQGVRPLAYMVVGWLFLLAGCSPKYRAPDLGQLYNRTAQYHDERRNPVILIPGILGSKLVDSQSRRIVWGSFAGDYANPQTESGARLIALPMREGVPLARLRDTVVPDGTLGQVTVKLFLLPIQLSAYQQILRSLGIGGYKDESGATGAIDYGKEHFTCFQFAYDWRLDNVENAKRLHEFILEKRAYIQKEYEKRYGVKNYDVKFDIVAHSMGGLIARYYLRYGTADLPEDGSLPEVTWAGSRYVERAILIGPPNAGSADALLQLIQGKKFGALLPKYEPAILGTMPAVYELLPRGRHGAVVDAANPKDRIEDILDPKLWQEMGWGLAAPDQDRVLRSLLPDVGDAGDRQRIALEHQRKSLERARQFMAALDTPATPPEGLTLCLIAGDAKATDAVIGVDRRTGEVKVIGRAPGDGTVLRSSALMDERLAGEWTPRLISPIHWSQVLFLFTEHLEMTKDPAFTDNLLFLLLEQAR